MRLNDKIISAVVYIILTGAVVAFLFPPVWMVLMSFKSAIDVVAFPPKFIFTPSLFSWEWFFLGSQYLAMGGQQGKEILTVFFPNSTTIALASTGITTFLASLTAFALARFEFKGRRQVAIGIIVTRMLPPIATAIPLYLLYKSLAMYDTQLGLVLAYTTINIPFAVIMLDGFIREVPHEIEESAMIDGCGRLTAFYRILCPLIIPGIAATAIFSFLLSWNDFPIAFFLTSNKAKTLPLAAMSFMGEEGIYWGPMCAYGTFYMLPVIIATIFIQKYLVKGLTMGAIKR